MSRATLIVPIAGKGTRFQKEGITTPKPLIKMGGRTLTQWSLSWVDKKLFSDIVFIDHEERPVCSEGDRLGHAFAQLVPDCPALETGMSIFDDPPGPSPQEGLGKLRFHHIGSMRRAGGGAHPRLHLIRQTGKLRGAADTILLSLLLMKKGNLDHPVITANCDQVIKGTQAFPSAVNTLGQILVFDPTGTDLTKWSYVVPARYEIRGRDLIPGNEVAGIIEKPHLDSVPAGDLATVGIYDFYTGNHLRAALLAYMDKPGNLVNGEYYLAPVYNQFLLDHLGNEGKVIWIKEDAMWGIGTPEDIDAFAAAHDYLGLGLDKWRQENQ